MNTSNFTLSLIAKLLLILLFSSVTTVSAEPAIISSEHLVHPTGRSQQYGIVVSQEKIASQVGAKILSAGGNAVDAAVAVGFALAVTYPQAGNLGGGGFMVHYNAKQRSTVAIDFREMAPSQSTADMYLDADQNVDQERLRFSALSSGVPGTVRGLIHALNQYGTMPLRKVMKPAIDLARSGFKISTIQSFSFSKRKNRFKRFPSSTKYLLNSDGETFPAGYLWRQPDLAKTLDKIARTNGKDFYTGAIAKKIVAEVQKYGGIISLDDMRNYKVIERKPLSTTYRGHQVVTMPPPSSGGVHLIQMLNALEQFDLTELGHNSSEYIHLLAEVMKQAYLDRSVYMGDSDFYPVPVDQLTSKKYGKSLSSFINPVRAKLAKEFKPGLGLIRTVPTAQPKTYRESHDTTHYSIVDKLGNVVSLTYTLNFSYGSGFAIAGLGFLMNNEMDDFVAKANVPNGYGLLGSEANAITGGKRPLSSMTPSIIFKNGEPVFVTGAPGGSLIITSVLQSILNFIEFDMNVAEATQAPRVHHQWFPDELIYERGISKDTLENLELLGHNIKQAGYTLGKIQAIHRSKGMNYGASDPRWPLGSVEFEK